MSVVINGTGSISGLSNVGGIDLPQSGSVLQVVSASSNPNLYTTSTTFQASSTSLAITPKYSTSKILVLISNGVFYQSGAADEAWASIFRQIGAGSFTNISPDGTNGIMNISAYASGNAERNPFSLMILDAPATTSAVTYKLYGKSKNGGSAGFGGDSVVTTLMEIAA